MSCLSHAEKTRECCRSLGTRPQSDLKVLATWGVTPQAGNICRSTKRSWKRLINSSYLYIVIRVLFTKRQYNGSMPQRRHNREGRNEEKHPFKSGAMFRFSMERGLRTCARRLRAEVGSRMHSRSQFKHIEQYLGAHAFSLVLPQHTLSQYVTIYLQTRITDL